MRGGHGDFRAHALHTVDDDDVTGVEPARDDAQALHHATGLDGAVLDDVLLVDDEHELAAEIGADRPIVDERGAIVVRAHELQPRK